MNPNNMSCPPLPLPWHNEAGAWGNLLRYLEPPTAFEAGKAKKGNHQPDRTVSQTALF